MKRKIPKKYQKGGVTSANPKPITKNRKKHARSIRKGEGNVLPDGKTETHRMATYTGENKKATYAAPTIAFDKDGNKKSQSFQQALEAGEVYEFKSKKRADKFAFGSWKKGKEKREAMKSYRKKMQTGGAPPTLQSRLENSWRAELGEIDDLVASGLGDMSPQAQAKMMERQGSLRGQLGLNKYGQPENKNTWTEGVKSDDWTFNTGGDRASSWEPGVQTFTYDPQKEKRKTDRAYRRANQQDTSTIYTGEGDDLNPELEGGKFNKESMTDPDSGLSKGIGAVAGLTGTYFDKLAGEDYAAREKKRDEAVANVESVEGLSPLYLENQRAMARKKGQQDLVEGYDYVGHGAKSGAAKGVGMGAQVAGPWGALVGAAIGGIGGGLMGKSKEEGDIFAAAAQTAKDRKRLTGMQREEISEIDPTKDEYGSVAAITVKKGGKIKKQAGGLIKGPGTGTSDDINGNLSEGDFVVTAENKNKALALRKQFGLPMQKANLQKGGKTMKKIPVKVSNGETLFTKKEIASMVKRGGGQVVDYLNSLAPEAEVPLQKGGKIALQKAGTVKKDNSQEMINKYGGKKEDWYYGRYTGDDSLVKNKIELDKLENEIKQLKFEKSKYLAKLPKSQHKNFTATSYGVEYKKKSNQLHNKLLLTKRTVGSLSNSVKAKENNKRLNSVINQVENEINKTEKQINNATTDQEVEKLAKKLEKITSKRNELKQLNHRVNIKKERFLSPDRVKTQIDDIIGVDEVAKQTGITKVSESDLGGAGVLKIKQTTKPIVPAKVTGAATQDASDIKKKQQAMANAGYDLGTTGPNKDGVDGIMGPKTQAAWDKFSKEQAEASDLSIFDEEAALYDDDAPEEWETLDKKEAEEEEEEVADKATEEAEREFPWSDLIGGAQAGMGLKGLAAMGQRPKGVKSADLLAQQRRIDAAQSQFAFPIDETLRDIERTRIASTIPTTGERGYEFAKRSVATGQAMSNIQKAREQKAILEGQAADRFGLAKLGMQGQMAGLKAAEDRRLFDDDMQAFQQKQLAYGNLLQAGIGNFLKGREARATRRSMEDLEGDVTVNIG